VFTVGVLAISCHHRIYVLLTFVAGAMAGLDESAAQSLRTHTHHTSRDEGDTVQQRQIAHLERQVAHLQNLHERAEGRLQMLLDCPNEIQRFKEKLGDPAVAVPLLQTYDAEIAHLKDKVTVLLHENAGLKADNATLKDAVQRGGMARTASIERQLGDERLQVRHEEENIHIRNLQRDNERLQGDLTACLNELNALREQASHGFATSSRQRDDEMRVHAHVHELEEVNRRLQADLAALEVKSGKLQKALESARNQDEDEKAANEAQRVQLQLLTQENEDKLHELDRLRAKMVQALHQAGENHNTHLKIIEEKHAEALRAVREEARAHEVVAAKLRAQVNRMDLVPSYAGGAAINSPTAAIEAQARHAQELELKRLYSELASAQLQRDDAVARLEHLTSLRKAEVDDKVRELARSLESSKLQRRELEERVEKLEAELTRSREACTAARADYSRALSDRTVLEREKAEAHRAVEEAKRAKQMAVTAQETAVAAATEEVDREKRAARALERRLEALRNESLAQKDRSAAELEQLQRTITEFRGALKDAQQRAEATLQTLAERDRAHDALQGKCERLMHGLSAHKQQLAQCDEKLLALTQRESLLAQELRTAQLALEQQRMENARTLRDRERLAAEGQALSAQLHKYARHARRAAP
jgi:hypothetical protein